MKNNEIITTVIYTFIAFTILAITLVVFIYFSRKKIIKNELEKKELELKLQKEVIKATITSQEKERNRIAQELHDDISSKLSVVSLNLHLLNDVQTTQEEATQLKQTIQILLDKTMDSARKIAHDLLPPIFEKFGLHAAIENLCEEFNATKKVKITYSNNLYFGSMDVVKNLHVFRILQELINNSIKHGKAKEINLVFKGDGNRNVCFYTDNGKGFNINHKKNIKGIGLYNIYNRIELIEGNISIESKINNGIKVEFSF
jgi:two-component system, NarL family, sensor kinase